MMNDVFFYVIVAAMLVVVVILAIGIGGFVKGGEFNQKYGNKMMRYRLAAQAFAVGLILIYVYFNSGGGN